MHWMRYGYYYFFLKCIKWVFLQLMQRVESLSSITSEDLVQAIVASKTQAMSGIFQFDVNHDRIGYSHFPLLPSFSNIIFSQFDVFNIRSLHNTSNVMTVDSASNEIDYFDNITFFGGSSANPGMNKNMNKNSVMANERENKGERRNV